MKYRIWVDIGYPPHALVLYPIITELERKGFEVCVTARKAFETFSLLDLKNVKYHKIGKHFGKKKFLKILGVIKRTIQLFIFAYDKRFSIAVSHGSPSQALTTKILRIPYVCMNDYEHTIGRGWLSTKILVPEYITDKILERKKVDMAKFVKYPGIKEDIYLPNFYPDSSILNELKVENRKIIATIRPPATDAHYHNPQSESLLFKTLDYLSSNHNVHIVLVARKEQKEIRLKCITKYKNCLTVPEKAIDGLNLIWHSDLVISGGGTMNREAAVLGVPAYSIFQGKIGAVDRYLEKSGKLQLLSSPNDLKKIKIQKRKPVWPIPEKKNLVNYIVDEILSVVK